MGGGSSCGFPSSSCSFRSGSDGPQAAFVREVRHDHVVGLAWENGDDLGTKADADPDGIGSPGRKGPVVEASAPAQTRPLRRKCQTGTEKGADRLGRYLRVLRRIGFENAEMSRHKGVRGAHRVECQGLVSMHKGVEEFTSGEDLREGCQLWFPREGRKDRDGSERPGISQPRGESLGNLNRARRQIVWVHGRQF